MDDDFAIARTVVWVLAGISVLVCFLLSASLIRSHLRHFTRPFEQRKIIGIIWLAPIFAIDSFLSLSVRELAPTMELFKECYEAYAMYLFFALLVEFLGGEERVIDLLQARTEDLFRPPPVRFILRRPITDFSRFFLGCKRGVMQFVLVRPIVGLASALFMIFSVEEDTSLQHELAWDRAYVYELAIVNVSVTYAFYCLICFYLALERELEPNKPLPKFLAIKSVVFLCFWQEILLAILAQTNVIVGDVKLVLQNGLVCFEMTLVAVYHHYAFPWSAYDRGSDYALPNSTGLLASSVGLEFGLAESTQDFQTTLNHQHQEQVEKGGHRPLLQI